MANLKFKLLGLCLYFVFGFAFLSNSFAAEDKILCVVGEDLITQKDLNEYLALASFELSAQYPDKKELEKLMGEVKKDALNKMIEERIVLLEAKRQKIKINEKIITDRVEQVRSQFPSIQDFEQSLISEGLTMSDVKNKVRDQLLVREVIDENVRSKIFIHPKEVTDYYKEHALEFEEPQEMVVDSIFVSSADSIREAERKIAEAMNLLKKGEDFSSVAARYSESPSLGKVERGQLKKEIEGIIFALKKDEFSNPVKTEKGFFIFKLKEIIPPTHQTLAAVQGRVYETVFQKKFQARFAEWLATIKKDVYCLIKQ